MLHRDMEVNIQNKEVLQGVHNINQKLRGKVKYYLALSFSKIKVAYIHHWYQIPHISNSFSMHDKSSNPMDFSLPGSSVHVFLQAKILEWVAISSSRGSSQPRDRTCISCVSCIGRWKSLPLGINK